jgi:hypothetical protein
MGDMRGAYRVLVGRREGDHLEDVGLDCRMILKMGLEEVGLGAWTGLMLLRIVTVGGLL